MEHTTRKIESEGLSVEEVEDAIPDDEDPWFARGRHLLAHWLLDRPMGKHPSSYSRTTQPECDFV
eukprot:3237445-Karenia_brevis.AAC.1